jgi:hypothetical protein
VKVDRITVEKLIGVAYAAYKAEGKHRLEDQGISENEIPVWTLIKPRGGKLQLIATTNGGRSRSFKVGVGTRASH